MTALTKTGWATCSQDPWYIECGASAYTSVGISHDGKIKAIAVGFGDEDYADEIVAALNSHAALVEENRRLRNKVAARNLTDKQLDNEEDWLVSVLTVGFGEGGGSPGEWYYERADEIDHEKKRRVLEKQLAEHNRRFPITHDADLKWVPWGVLEPHEAQARANHKVGIAGLAARGGITPCEAVAIIEGRPWERMPLTASTLRLKELVEQWKTS